MVFSKSAPCCCSFPVLLLVVDPVSDVPSLLPSEDPVSDVPSLLPSEDPVSDVPSLLPSEDPVSDVPSLLPSEDPLAYITAEAGKKNKVTINSTNKLVIRIIVGSTIASYIS